MNDGIATTDHQALASTLTRGDLSETDSAMGAEQSGDLSGYTEMVIEPQTGWIRVDFRELWFFRELMWFLVWRDVKIRYKQTVFGVAWAVLVPIFSVTIFTVIFGNFADMKSTLPENLVSAYPVYVYAGLLPWLFFSSSVSLGGMSLVNQRQLLTKIYFPRLFVPTAQVTGGLVDMGLSFCVFMALMMIYRAPVSPMIVLLPGLVFLIWMAGLGVAFTLSSLTVTYRDFRFVIPFMVQAWQFLSPVVYSTNIVPERYRYIYAINPLAGIIEGFRSVIFGLPMPWGMLAVSTLSTVCVFCFGVMYFRKTERRFADIA